jgi:hypothetical protein
MNTTTTTKPSCQLTGTDGNVFSVIGRVSGALKRAGLRAQSSEFCKKAMGCASYDDVLALCFDYVDVE